MNDEQLNEAYDAFCRDAVASNPPLLNRAHLNLVQEFAERCLRYREEIDTLRLQVSLASELATSHNVHLADLYQRYQYELQAMKETHGEEVARMQEQIEAANERIEEALHLHEMQERFEQTARENELFRSEIFRLHKKCRQKWTYRWVRLLKSKKQT